ncbi:MAG: hypothetical protein EOM06_07215 [Sphingobacteriia bacterium]|nr:hypothetical protein [Sphingobacteriia bacterium]
MKTKKNFLLILGLIIGFAAGLIVGMIFNNPEINTGDAAGSIGKVDKYRNVKITEADIALKNELLADEKLRNAFVNYMDYEYSASVKLTEDIKFALSKANEVTEFSTDNQIVTKDLEKYLQLLENARAYLFEASFTVKKLDAENKIAMSTILNNANNAIAQIRQENTAVFNFMTAMEQFFDKSERGTYLEMEEAYSGLFGDMIATSVVSNDRVTFEYLLSKDKLFQNTSTRALNNEALQGWFLYDAEKMGIQDMENLNVIYNAEQLGVIVTDVESLGTLLFIYDAENLGAGFSLGTGFTNIAAYDAEKLESFRNINDLGAIADMQSLQIFVKNVQDLQASTLLDAAALGDMMNAQSIH